MFESLAKQLRGGVPDRLSSVLGSDLRDTRRAMEVSLPALIGGLRDRANEPGGPDAIVELIDGPAGQPIDDVDSYLTDTDPRVGASALDQIFGSRGEPALTSLSKASGLSTKLLAQVMSMLGPVVTGWLSQKVADDDMSPNELKRYLDSEADRLDQAGYGKVLALVGGRSTVASPTSTPSEPSPASKASEPVVVGGGESRQRIVTVSDGGTDYEDSYGVPDTPDQISSKSIANSGSVPVMAAAGAGAVAAGAAAGGASASLQHDQPTTATPAYQSSDGDLDYGDERSSRSILWWVLAGLMLAVGAFFVFQMCTGDSDNGDGGADTDTATDSTGAQAAATNAISSYPNAAVQVTGTTAVLSGRVDNINDKKLVEQTVMNIEGIDAVENVLNVGNGSTVVDFAANSEDLTQFNAMLEANPDVKDQLLVGQPYTVFIPSDDAFAAADQAVIGSLQADPATWKQVLQYHITASRFSSDDLKSGGTFATLATEMLETGSDDAGEIYLNGTARIILADQEAEYDSLIQVVDNVLIPPSLGGEVRPVEGGGGAAAEGGEGGEGGETGGGATLNDELSLGSVTFESGSSTITAEGTAEVDKVVTYMTDNPDVTVEIGGHTDSLGEDAANQTLSQERADAVKTYMEGNGIAAERLTAVGYGETQLLVSPDDTAEQQAQNRRIEFKITS